MKKAENKNQFGLCKQTFSFPLMFICFLCECAPLATYVLIKQKIMHDSVNDFFYINCSPKGNSVTMALSFSIFSRSLAHIFDKFSIIIEKISIRDTNA